MLLALELCLVPHLPISPLSPGPLPLGFPKLLTSLFWELSLSPCLLGHSPESGPLPEVLEHPVGVFVIALLTLHDVEPSCPLLSASPLVSKSSEAWPCFTYLCVPSILHNSRHIAGAMFIFISSIALLIE